MSAREARARIADLILPPSPDLNIGQVLLQPHQAEAVARIQAAISNYGGALLCDPVGTGKTFSALGLAARYDRVTLVAPAVLEDMWTDASAKAGVRISFRSHESLSRVRKIRPAGGLVIVDEAHHARNPATKRFRALSTLVHGADVLLLTATPVHNRPRDLAALQSLYLGDRAVMLEPGEIAETVVRRSAPVTSMPAVSEVEWLSVASDGTIPEMILDLPPPLPVREGGVANVLIRHSLVRQWASSDAALRWALTRRRNRAGGLIAALETGRYPSKSELSAWSIGEDAVQLAFPELVATASGPIGDLLPVIRKHATALDAMIPLIRGPTARDRETACRINDMCDRHRGIPIVVFSAFEETVVALFRLLKHSGGVAALTGRGGRVASGAISRREIISRFAPRASGCRAPSAANRVSLLIATDLLSEGMNLQDAGVVVHVDLPFTQARLEQRLGRVARLGSLHAEVRSYAFKPPATAETIARIEGLLGMKLSFALEARSIPDASARVTERLREWQGDSVSARVGAAVDSEAEGFLAVVQSGAQSRMLAGINGQISNDPELLLRAVDSATGHDAPVDHAQLERCIRALKAHLAIRDSLGSKITPRSRDLVHRRIARILRHARRHERARLAGLADRAISIADGAGGSMVDATLRSLSDARMSDEEWLSSVAAVDPLRVRTAATREEIVAVILFVVAAR